jgi:hypothetical protein
MRAIALAAAVLTASCSDLDGLSGDGTGAGAGKVVLRTQASASGPNMTSFELVTSSGAKDGDLLFYAVVTKGASLRPPSGLTLVDDLKNSCASTHLYLYTARAVESSQVTQKFELDSEAANVEATLLVVSGLDPVARSNTSKVANADEGDATFAAAPVTVAGGDLPAQVLLSYVYPPSSEAPEGTTLFAKNGPANFFLLAASSAGAIEPPPSPAGSRTCGFAIATVFKQL